MKRMLFNLVLIGIVSIAGPAWADLESGLGEVTKYLVNVVGAAVFVIGIIVTGYGFAMGNAAAKDRGIWVIVGGILIFSAEAIMQLVRGWFR